MVVDPKIKQKAEDIRKKIFGSEVRESLASGLEGMSEDVESIKDRQDTVETTFQEVIDETTDKDVISAPEIIAARGGHSNLSQRLLSTDQQLVQSERNIDISNGVIQYGKLKFPSDFTEVLPFDIFRDFDGKLKHTFDFKNLKSDTHNVYVSREIGSETESGLTAEQPVVTLSRALAIANGLESDNVNIVFLDKVTSVYLTNPAIAEQVFSLSKNICLMSANEGGTFIFTGNNPLNWSEDLGIYKVSRSATNHVYDYNHKDFKGNPKQYEKVENVTECVNTRGTWYTDGVSVWVNTLDSVKPTNNLMLMLPIDASIQFNLNGYSLTIDNVNFWLKQNTKKYNALKVFGNAQSRLYLKNTSFSHSQLNGLAVSYVGKTYVFNSTSNKNGSDGFNYHGYGNEFVFEYDCYAHDNGAVIATTGNATTAHDGMTILRVGSVGHDCYGPILADVNGCYSLNYDCVMYDSLLTPSATKAGFWFDGALAQKRGIAYLINCQGGGTNTHTVNGDGNVDIFVRNLKGNNLPNNLNLQVIN